MLLYVYKNDFYYQNHFCTKMFLIRCALGIPYIVAYALVPMYVATLDASTVSKGNICLLFLWPVMCQSFNWIYLLKRMRTKTDRFYIAPLLTHLVVNATCLLYSGGLGVLVIITIYATVRDAWAVTHHHRKRKLNLYREFVKKHGPFDVVQRRSDDNYRPDNIIAIDFFQFFSCHNPGMDEKLKNGEWWICLTDDGNRGEKEIFHLERVNLLQAQTSSLIQFFGPDEVITMGDYYVHGPLYQVKLGCRPKSKKFILREAAFRKVFGLSPS